MKRVIVIAAVMSLALPALAGAKIVPGRSMFGITLGASQAQVRAKLGKPTEIVHVTGEAEWVYAARHAVILFNGRHSTAGALYTQSQSERTANGIGVGSTRQDVERKLPGASCTAHGCLVLVHRAGSTYGTDFALNSSGRVTSILVTDLS